MGLDFDLVKRQRDKIRLEVFLIKTMSWRGGWDRLTETAVAAVTSSLIGNLLYGLWPRGSLLYIVFGHVEL